MGNTIIEESEYSWTRKRRISIVSDNQDDTSNSKEKTLSKITQLSGVKIDSVTSEELLRLSNVALNCIFKAIDRSGIKYKKESELQANKVKCLENRISELEDQRVEHNTRPKVSRRGIHNCDDVLSVIDHLPDSEFDDLMNCLSYDIEKVTYFREKTKYKRNYL